MTGKYFLLICDDVPNAVVLTDPGPHPVEVVKLLRRRTGLSLWHSKSLISRLPATGLEDVPQEVAEATVRELLLQGVLLVVEEPGGVGDPGACDELAVRRETVVVARDEHLVRQPLFFFTPAARPAAPSGRDRTSKPAAEATRERSVVRPLRDAGRAGGSRGRPHRR
ncbi:ribosomal protein L7/L12 [Kitasatospora sp. NPDC092286]|uniref:ribosomal protein L7/L12 n=1 Tax=Kitasatospora sp. NPDC092286 TaxID=3364087 RepID=UPI0037F4C8B7